MYNPFTFIHIVHTCTLYTRTCKHNMHVHSTWLYTELVRMLIHSEYRKWSVCACLTTNSSRLSFILIAQAKSCCCATLSTASMPPARSFSFSFSFLSSPLPLKVELLSSPFRFIFDFCDFFPPPPIPSISAPASRLSLSTTAELLPSTAFRCTVLCLFLGLLLKR